MLRARAANGGGRALALALSLRERPQGAIGGVELTFEAAGAARLGYWLGQPFRGRGYMAEAIEALTSLAYGLTELAAIEAEARVDNEASLGVLSRLGFAEAGRRLTHQAPGPTRRAHTAQGWPPGPPCVPAR